MSQWFARTPYGERFTLLLAQVASMDEPRNNVTIIEMKIIVFAKNVRWNDRSEVASVLGLVHAVLDVHHTLSIRVPFVREVRWPVVNHGFVDGKRRLVRKDARRKTRNELFDPFSAASEEHRASVKTHRTL